MTNYFDSCAMQTMKSSSVSSIKKFVGYQKANRWQDIMELQNSVVEFLGEDSDLAKDVIACHQYIRYLVYFFEKINTATSKPQGKNIALVQSKTIICGLINKLELYQQTLSRGNFYHFSRLSKMSLTIICLFMLNT